MADNNIVDMTEKVSKNWRRWIKSGIILIILIAIIVIALLNTFIVQQGEYKIVRQFGEVVRIEDEPGINLKVPFIQSVSTLPKYQMNYDAPPTEINTRDKKRMLVDNYVIWRVESPQQMISNARTIETAESIMSNFINSVIRSELGRKDYDEIINEEGDSARGDLNQQVTERVNELLVRDGYGVTVTDVRMKRTDLPEDNEQSVYRRMISERESTAQEYLSQGDAEANRIRANTDREVTEILSKAEAEAAEIIGEGEAEAAQIYNESFSRDPEFYSLYRTLESYKETIDDETVITLPADSPYARILMGYIE